jgi:hypothetical protein
LANDLWAQTALFACVLVILVVLAAKYAGNSHMRLPTEQPHYLHKTALPKCCIE